MNNEQLRADIKRELSWAQPTAISELLNRCYVALGEQQQSVSMALRAKLIDGLDEITSLSRNLRHGGCDSTDLLGLEEGLIHAIDVASEMLSLLAAAPSPVQSVLKVKCGTCLDSGIVGHSDICPECAGSWKPASAPVQGAWKLVPVELLEELRDAANEAHNEATRPNRMKFFAALVEKADAILDAPSAPAAQGWIPVSERLPNRERTVLAFYLNSHGKGRRVRAEYIAAKTKSADDGWDSDSPPDYDEQADEYFWPAGWYEVIDNWDDLTHLTIHEGTVTHWMPLPAAPAAQGGE